MQAQRGVPTSMGGSSGPSTHDGRGTSQPMGGSSFPGGWHSSYSAPPSGPTRGYAAPMGGSSPAGPTRRHGGHDYSPQSGGVNLFGLFSGSGHPVRTPGGRPPRRGRPADRSFRSVSLEALALLAFFGAMVRSVAIVATGVLMFAAVLIAADEE